MGKMRQGEAKPARRFDDTPEVDCDVCIRRTGCERAASGSFCTRFASREAPDRGPGPMAGWSTGEDVW